MRIAVLADIHGNIAALDAVLADIARRGVSRIVNLGDICSGALFPRETADRLMPLGLPTIAGNHERQLSDRPVADMGPSDRHAALMLRPDQRTWLAALPATAWACDDVCMVHGTPGSDVGYFLETVTADGLRPATAAEIERRAGGTDAAVVLCGHTHVPRIVARAGGRLVVNPGSVGLPAYEDDRPCPHRVENGSPHARYAILSRLEGRWTADLHAVAYDWERAARDAEAHGRPDWARALRTGLA